jgi:S-adenosylmethionine/arginine decarboxylase-like enzyme
MLNNPNPHEKNFYGQELILNLYDCNLKKISSEKSIYNFVVTLCDKVIKMKRYGEPLIPHFGHENPLTSGYSLVQLIETSSVTGHFSEYKKSCYINIFSCAWFDIDKTIQFTQEFFQAKKAEATFIKRF